jgi:hypothetical protein
MVISEEINIRINGLSRADCPPPHGRHIMSSVGNLKNKGRVRRNSFSPQLVSQLGHLST